MTLCCDEHHALVTDGTYTTTIAGPDHPYPGRTIWTANHHLDPHRQTHINHYHHPEQILYPPDNPKDPPQQHN